jgi:voltage-dependent calcium channel L type alpha-1D
MLLLLQSVTGDGWTLLLQDSLVQEESGLCTEGSSTEGCGSWVAIPYFVTFQLFGTLVFLNLMVAVILENFTSLSEQVRG